LNSPKGVTRGAHRHVSGAVEALTGPGSAVGESLNGCTSGNADDLVAGQPQRLAARDQQDEAGTIANQLVQHAHNRACYLLAVVHDQDSPQPAEAGDDRVVQRDLVPAAPSR
jgi:hypothetical protein